MEEAIDLRQYVAVLVKYWYWLVGLAIVMAIIAFGISTVISPTYQATALVAAIQPRYQLQFDPRFQNIPESNVQALLLNQYRAYPTLATSDELLLQVAAETGWSLANLKRSARATADFNLFTLTVSGKDAQEVAQVANIWAELFVKKANVLYRGANEAERLKAQQEQAAQALAQADAALTAFREENGFGFEESLGLGLIGQRLQVKRDLLTQYEVKLVRLNQMQREVKLLSTSPLTSPVLVAGLLSEMINTGAVRDSPVYQINLDAVDPAAGLAAMEVALAAQAAAIEAETDPLRTEIADLQVELAAKQSQLERLSREKDVNAETYLTLSRKAQEVALEASGTGPVKVASQAAVPTRPASPRRMLNTAMGGVAGLMLGVFGVFTRTWWRNGQAEAQAVKV